MNTWKVFVVMPVPDRVRDDVSGIQERFLYMDWIPAAVYPALDAGLG